MLYKNNPILANGNPAAGIGNPLKYPIVGLTLNLANLKAPIVGKRIKKVMLWKLFEKRGGIKEAEKCLNNYYDFYKYKEVNTQEFVRFTKYYFNLKSNSVFKGWLLLKDS